MYKSNLFIFLFALALSGLVIGCGGGNYEQDYSGSDNYPSPVSPRSSEPVSNVIVNNVRLNNETLNVLAVHYGITIEDGEYWYDTYSGAWGYENGPTFGFIAPDLNIGGRLPVDASNGQTGVLLNGRELPVEDLLYLEGILGPIPDGSYWLDPYGNMGVEGYAAQVNIIDIQTSVTTSSSNPYQAQGDDFIMAAGGCTIASDGVIC